MTVVCLAMGVLFSIRAARLASVRRTAIAAADSDWESGRAQIYLPPHDRQRQYWEQGDIFVSYEVDRKTGLWQGLPRPSDHGFLAAYHDRIVERLRVEGPPPWSLHRHLPSPEELAALLDADDLVEVASFPYELTPQLVLMRRGTLEKWGQTIEVQDGWLNLVTDSGIPRPIEYGVLPVAVRDAGPIVIVRNGNRWVGILDRTGSILAQAERGETIPDRDPFNGAIDPSVSQAAP